MAMAMKVLDLPLHSLASNCVSFGLFALVNNLWTLVAVVTAAALSFWSIRFRAASSPAAVISPPTLDRPPHLHDPEPPEASPSPSTDVPAPSLSTLPAVACGGDSVTKGKFSVYYENLDGPVWGSDGEVEVVGPWAAGEVHWIDLEGVMMMKKTRLGDDELGWYRFQDRTVLNGSVVRLWKLQVQGRRRSKTSFSGGLISTSVVDS